MLPADPDLRLLRDGDLLREGRWLLSPADPNDDDLDADDDVFDSADLDRLEDMEASDDRLHPRVGPDGLPSDLGATPTPDELGPLPDEDSGSFHLEESGVVSGRWGSGSAESERFVVLPPSDEVPGLPEAPEGSTEEGTPLPTQPPAPPTAPQARPQDDPTIEDDPLPDGPPSVFDSAPPEPSAETANLSDSDLGAFGSLSSDGDDLSALAAEALADAKATDHRDEVETGFGFDYGTGKMLSSSGAGFDAFAAESAEQEKVPATPAPTESSGGAYAPRPVVEVPPEEVVEPDYDAAPMVDLRGIHKQFGDRKILRGVDLAIYPGETVCIIGGSGTGKSVTLKTIMRLIDPDQGEVWLDGENITKAYGDKLQLARTKLGVNFQFGALLNWLTVFENVALPLRENTKWKEDQIEKRVMDKLELLSIPHARDLFPTQISGGMKKRAGLARAVVMEESIKVILYDEPTSGLDPISTAIVDDMVNEMKARLRLTQVIVTHDMTSAYRTANRIAVLHEGKVVQFGTAEEIQTSKVPYVQQFVRGLSTQKALTDRVKSGRFKSSRIQAALREEDL